MKRRLYYVFPNVAEAKKALNQLLLQRICIHNIHVIANDTVDLEDLPEASIFQKNDIRHSIILGLLIGSIIGIVAGIIAHELLTIAWGGGLIATTIIGALLGAWTSSMIGLMAPNIHLKRFQKTIDAGKILMLVDVPKEKITDIEKLLKKHHPKARFKGVEPTIPGYP